MCAQTHSQCDNDYYIPVNKAPVVFQACAHAHAYRICFNMCYDCQCDNDYNVCINIIMGDSNTDFGHKPSVIKTQWGKETALGRPNSTIYPNKNHFRLYKKIACNCCQKKMYKMYLCPHSHLHNIYTSNSRHMTHYLLAHVKNANKKPIPTDNNFFLLSTLTIEKLSITNSTRVEHRSVKEKFYKIIPRNQMITCHLCYPSSTVAGPCSGS